MIRGLLIAALIGFVAALATLTRAGDQALYPAGPGAGTVTVYLLENGFHTDLAIPRPVLSTGGGTLANATRDLPPGEWISVGWGDAHFYVDPSPVSGRLPDGARALLRPGNASVVRLDPDARHPDGRYGAEASQALRLSEAGMAALRDRIESSLETDGQGRAVIAASRANDDARFYRSRETFWLGHLCNHWAAELLNAAGIEVRPFRSLTSAEVMGAAERAAVLDLQVEHD